MFIFKLKRNNKAYSSLSWMAVMLATIIILCGILDVMNLARVRTVLISRVDLLSNIATVQGGIEGSAVTDWGAVFPSTAYITSSQAKKYFENGFNVYKSTFVQNVSLEGVPCHVEFTEPGVISGSVTFIPIFSKGWITKPFTIKHQAEFAGFWIHKSMHM